MASGNNYYVTSPIGSDYEGVNSEVISRGIDFSKRTHRLLSGFGENENRYDGGSTSFKYLEGTLFSTKDVKFLDSDPSMLETGFIKSTKDKEGCVYKVLRFDREHNIRTFDFIITYTQLSDWESKTYKPIPVTRQFRGSLLFTGCSIIRDTDTMEELPLKLYAKYESIGDTIGENVDIDGKLDTKGGPALTFTYTYDSEYVYLYISSISPFRLIPSGDGEFKDVSYLDDTGTFVGETKSDVQTIKDPTTGLKKTSQFSRNKTIWCDVNISMRDMTVCHTNGDCHAVDYDSKLEEQRYTSKATSFQLVPTNDGEQMVIGMSPDSDVNLEIAQDTKPIRFGSRLLKTDMSKVEKYINSLSERIKTASTNIEQVSFVIKTTIRTRGKYNIRGEYFIDDKADSFGQILIQDIGVYDVLTDSFDITEYITDKNTLVSYKASTVSNYRKYINNASDYLTKISDGAIYPHVRKTSKLLDIISNIQFEADETLDVYSDIAYIRAPVAFDVAAAYAEFGDDETVNTDDKIVYICKNGDIKVCGFKDYEMDDAITYSIFKDMLPAEIINSTYVTTVDRAWNGDHYIYCVGTNNGIYALIEGITEGQISVEIKDAFIKGTSNGEFSTGEEVVYLKSDNEYFYIGGKDGSIRIINIDNLASTIPSLHFQYNDSIKYAELISDDTILFISQLEACTYNLNSGKWNFEGDDYRLQAKFWNPFGSMKVPNKDLIICKDGYENVPTIQVGQFVYALGLRKDTSGYASVYKCLDTVTGESIDIPEPAEFKYRVYRPQLCKEENLIYMVGGTVANFEPTKPEELSTKVSVFDTKTNTWVKHFEVSLTKDNEARSFYSPNFHPGIVNGKIYIIKPRVSYFIQNAITGLYSTAETYDPGMYIIDTANESFEYTEVTGLPDQVVNANAVNIVPAMVSGKNIIFLSGMRNVTYDSTADSYTFNGYNLYRITLNTEDNSITYTTQLVNSVELANCYSGNKANSARTDLFSYYSMYTEYNEGIIYCLDCYAVIYFRIDVPYAEVHLIFHSLLNATFKPLITEGEYASWCNYNKLPDAVSLVHVDNYLAFLGGNASRVDGYLSLDTISWIPSPRYSPRTIGNQDSAVLNDNSDAISVISTEKNIVDQVSGCKVGSTEYLLAVIKNESEYSTVLYKYNLDDPTAKIEFVKDLTADLVSDAYPEGFINWTLTPLGDDVILFAPYTGYTGGMYSKCNVLNVFGYKISTRSVGHVVSDSNVLSSTANIYALEGIDKVIYTTKDNVSVIVTETSAGLAFVTDNETNFFGSLNIPYTEIDQGCIVPSVSRGKFAIAAVAYNEAIVLHKFDTIDGEESVNDSSFLYTIDNSKGYKNPQLFLNGDDLYLTKGYKLDAAKDGEGSTDKAFSIEIIKLEFSEAAGIKTGSDNDRMHALLSVNTSNMYAPFAISRSGKITVFGEVRVDWSKGEINNTKVRFIPLESTITGDTFVNMNTHVTLTGASKSATNRYTPTMKTMHADGHELVLVFGGHASPETNVTKTLDVYDTARHIWKNICDLPEFISHVSTKENVILGGTTEVLKDGTQVPYTKRIEIICNDYDTLDFSVKVTDRPEYSNYPVYASWTENATKDITYVVPMTAEGGLKNETILKIVGNNVTGVIPIDSTVIYNSNYKLIGSLVLDDSLVIVLFNNMTYEISFWKHVNGSWSKVTYVTEPNNIDITSKAFAFDVNFEDYKAITNGEIYDAKAVLAYVDPSSVNSKGVLVSYLRLNESGNISVSTPETFAYIPGDDLSSVDSVEVSRDGFTYYSKNNSSNGEVRRIFPNNNTLGFGCRRLEAADLSKVQAKYRLVSDNYVYTVYADNTLSKINLDTDTHETLDGILQIGDSSIKNAKIFGNAIIGVTNNGTLFKAPLDNIDNLKTVELAHDVNYSRPTIIRDLEEDSFTLIYGYADNSETNEKEIFSCKVDINEFKVEESTHSTSILKDANYVFINEDLDVVYKYGSSDMLIVSSLDGKYKNCTSIPDDINLCLFDYGTVYGVDHSGKVFELVVRDFEFVRSGYTYSTTTFDREIPKDACLRNSDIILFDRGFRYINPTVIDFNHYCYDNIAVDHDINTSFEDKVVSIGVSTENSDAFLVYTSEKETHIVETRKTVVDSNDKVISGIPIGSESTLFVDKVHDVIHLYIADPKTGTVYNINTYTGITTKTKISDLKGDGKITAIKNNSETNTYYLHLSGNIVSYNTDTDSVVSSVFNISEGNVVKLILKIDPYNKFIRALYCKDGDETYSYGVFSGSNLDLRSCSETNIRTIYNKIETSDNDRFIIINSNNDAIEVDISDNGANATAVRFISDYYKYIDTVSDKPLITFHGNIVSGNDTGDYMYKFDDVIFTNNDYIINNHKVTDIKCNFIVNVFKYKSFFIVLDCESESGTATRARLIDVDSETECNISVSDEIFDMLSSNKTTVEIPTDKYFDSLNDVSKFGNILSVNGNEDVHIINLTIAGDNDLTTDNEISMTSFNISEVVEMYDVDLSGKPVVSRSNTVTFYSKASENTAIFVMSPTYGNPSIIVEDSLTVNDTSILFVVADTTFVVDKSNWFAAVVYTGINGERKNVSGSNKVLTITLSNKEKESLKRIPSGIYYGDNDRICHVGTEDIYFNPVRAISEYYSRYIGVGNAGDLYDAAVPISKFDISAVAIASLHSDSTIMRAEGNIIATPYIIYKSDSENVVAHLPIVTRLNTAKFVKDYDKTDDLSVGNIYAFTENSLNGSLVRDDTSYYRGEYVAAIINSKTVKIRVDDAVLTFSNSDGEFPFDYEILPIVMAYGTRTEKNGSTGYRYYSFIDVRGNVSTFDKELETFVDIDGNVAVSVPFFSSNIQIIPNTASRKNDVGAEVWAYSDNNPYSDVENKGSDYITNYIKKNANLLK